MSDFKESDHPRGPDGKFGNSGKVKITPTEKAALEWYSEQGFHEINSRLRRGDDSNKTTVKAIDEAIEKSTLSESKTLYRGVSREALKGMLGKGEGIKVGDVFEDKSFLSTSTNYGVAKSFGSSGVVLSITTKAGQKGIDMKDISSNPNENEVLLPREQKLSITGLSKPDPSKGQYWPVLHVEAV